MTPTEKAILARFDGDKTQAYWYCERMSKTYPHLAPEYDALAFRFGWSNPEVVKVVCHV